MVIWTLIFQSEQSQGLLKIERRISVRYPSKQDMTCQPTVCLSNNEVGTIWLGRVLNISPSGIGFTTSRPFGPGRMLIVDLSDESKGTSLRRPARVVPAIRKTKNRWIIGCEAISSFCQKELQILLSK
jgi:hypothetical protein